MLRACGVVLWLLALLGGTIPIFFHWVLAAYLFTLARFHVRARHLPPLSEARP